MVLYHALLYSELCHNSNTIHNWHNTIDREIFVGRASRRKFHENFNSMQNDHYCNWPKSKINRSENLKDEIFRERKYTPFYGIVYHYSSLLLWHTHQDHS